MVLSNTILGIDLGTTFSAMAYVDKNGMAKIIPNSQGERTTPSVVMFQHNSDDVIIGQEAKGISELYPDRTIAFVKREMGKKPNKVRDGCPYFFKKRNYSPEEISSFILKKLKKDAEKYLNTKLNDAVISVPAYFSDIEREATIRAGELAGLNVKRIINEPTAAALYYGFHKSNNDQKALVFDLGGGTFDVTILGIKENKVEVIGTDGDHKLGGVDWDNKILDYIAEKFLLEYGMDPLDDHDTRMVLLSKVERAKIQLSERDQTKIVFSAHDKKFSITFNREMFNDLTSDLFERCNDLCNLVLEECKLGWNKIDSVILAGGSTRMPMVKEMLTRVSGKTIQTGLVNPDECVALGAAIQGEILKKKTDPEHLVKSENYRSFGVKEIVDVTAHSLGMIVLDKNKLKNSIIIPKNHSIPCELSKSDFTTIYDNQDTLDIYIVQGESENPFHCNILDSYQFYDITKRPRGKTKIQVIFKYNENSVVEVKAIEVNSNKSLPFERQEKPNLSDLEKEISRSFDIFLLIDCSGSMEGKLLKDAKQAAHRFVENIDLSSNMIGLISFNSEAFLRQDLTNVEVSLFHSITSLSSSGTTNMSEAIKIACQAVTSSNSNNDKIIVLLTDGYPDNDNLTIIEGENLKNLGIRIITIGVGHDVDSEFLKKLASSPLDYHFVSESFNLESTFLNIATELSSSKISTFQRS